MLHIVGLGITDDSIPSNIRNIMQNADVVYLETFTSPDINTSEIRRICPKLQMAPRWMVEDGRRILKESEKKDVVLASYGDPLVATTHTDLRVRAVQSDIPVNVVHGPSAITILVGECGLHHYMMGRMVTVMSEDTLLETPYMASYRNAALGNHTLLLLEYNQDTDFFLGANAALKKLSNAEKSYRRGVFAPDSYCMVACRIGTKKQLVVSGRVSSLEGYNFGDPPHSIILTGRLHFTECDAIRALTTCVDNPPEGHTIKSISRQMIEKYTPMIQKSIQNITGYSDGENMVIQNAISYIQDAQAALEKGQDEVAVLSIGYADGLIDALRMSQGMDPGSLDPKI
ncbi:MAG: diphthine synthase [Cenarchaeum sp. SB0665_bin_23]|nr:diphthine synthase [Cenarchaeum sp. SB0667_bin_13]MXY37740.1 diphthine synthase [Cenarchaeum sp. SB0664_bin_35]MXY61814.1 diphthine synthase [Cenarchaeum sp. SB0665_bin_23]MXZ92931.1 diphthine synthase [Cenarchaeum sp. SB0666_bin_15]MYB46947.1 diphthine synthase [Cenarchaeum sp. SB0662_bin_33]MYC80346.1 diphthine synthase [Cenarchaeum sp. SB0661_bin_35]MYD59324.1 diphthine synthase [Cenarchaeum sp. SB0678_bin_8]MYG33431.1 diphthine synthase [Cenarchaeum sp. SB0677_bin_16]MYI51356.1 dipht